MILKKLTKAIDWILLPRYTRDLQKITSFYERLNNIIDKKAFSEHKVELLIQLESDIYLFKPKYHIQKKKLLLRFIGYYLKIY